MADEKTNITDTTKQGTLASKIKTILIVIGIIGICTAAARSQTIAMWISGWSK
jgi:hypothetical protein